MSRTNHQNSSPVANESLFTRLRKLAVNIEDVIQSTQAALETKHFASQNTPAKATNFLLHAKAELTGLKSEVDKQLVNFALRNTTMDRIQTLMKSVMEVVAERLENVEEYMGKYGYVRPAIAHAKKTDDSGDDKESQNDGPSEINPEVDETGDELNDENSRDSPKTPPPHVGSGTVRDQHILRTPRIEDLYKQLSEHTIQLLQQGSSKKDQLQHQSESRQSSQTTDTSLITSSSFRSSSSSASSASFENRSERPPTPELPVLQTVDLNSYSFSYKSEPTWTGVIVSTSSATMSTPEAPKLHMSWVHSSTAASTTDEPTWYPTSTTKEKNVIKTPEPPTLLTPGLKLDSFAVHTGEKQGVKSARALFNTPPMPELKTRVLKGYGASAVALNETKPVVQQRPQISTPEPPKLFARGMDYGKYYGYSSDTNNL